MEISTIVLLTAGFMSIIFGVVILLFTKFNKVKPDGYLDVSARNNSQIYQLDIQTEPEELRKKKYLTFEVRQIPDL